MIKGKIARRYAKGLFLLGQEATLVERYGEELKTFSDAVSSHEELQAVLANPVYTIDARLEIVQTLCQKLSLSERMRDFLSFLVEEGRIPYLAMITQAYQRMVDESLGRVRTEVTTAVELNEAEIDRLKRSLSKMLNREPVLTQHLDPDIIGGIRITVGSTVYDGTVKNQLELMRERLNTREA